MAGGGRRQGVDRVVEPPALPSPPQILGSLGLAPGRTAGPCHRAEGLGLELGSRPDFASHRALCPHLQARAVQSREGLRCCCLVLSWVMPSVAPHAGLPGVGGNRVTGSWRGVAVWHWVTPSVPTVSPATAQQGQTLQVSKLLPGVHGLSLTADPPLGTRHQTRQGLLLQHVWQGLYLGERGAGPVGVGSGALASPACAAPAPGAGAGSCSLARCFHGDTRGPVAQEGRALRSRWVPEALTDQLRGW